MRTTLTLDDDVLAVARELAEQRHVSIGAVVSELSRQGIAARRTRTTKRSGIPNVCPPAKRRPDHERSYQDCTRRRVIALLDHLLALAHRWEGSLATFDKGIRTLAAGLADAVVELIV